MIAIALAVLSLILAGRTLDILDYTRIVLKNSQSSPCQEIPPDVYKRLYVLFDAIAKDHIMPFTESSRRFNELYMDKREDEFPASLELTLPSRFSFDGKCAAWMSQTSQLPLCICLSFLIEMTFCMCNALLNSYPHANIVWAHRESLLLAMMPGSTVTYLINEKLKQKIRFTSRYKRVLNGELVAQISDKGYLVSKRKELYVVATAKEEDSSDVAIVVEPGDDIAPDINLFEILKSILKVRLVKTLETRQASFETIKINECKLPDLKELFGSPFTHSMPCDKKKSRSVSRKIPRLFNYHPLWIRSYLTFEIICLNIATEALLSHSEPISSANELSTILEQAFWYFLPFSQIELRNESPGFLPLNSVELMRISTNSKNIQMILHQGTPENVLVGSLPLIWRYTDPDFVIRNQTNKSKMFYVMLKERLERKFALYKIANEMLSELIRLAWLLADGHISIYNEDSLCGDAFNPIKKRIPKNRLFKADDVELPFPCYYIIEQYHIIGLKRDGGVILAPNQGFFVQDGGFVYINNEAVLSAALIKDLSVYSAKGASLHVAT